jgi:hemoglobin/transferrin/lactoferrin receptor protein
MVCGAWRARAHLFGVSVGAVMVGMAAGAQAQTLLDPFTVLATKTNERAIDALAGVSTVRQTQIDQIMPKRTSDLFHGLPSVWFDQRGDSPETSINIRGLQDFGRVAVVVDGARQNFQRSGHNANGTFYLEPELIAGLDVIRGPVANIYGSGAIGGVASFRTKDVQDILMPGERYGAQGNIMAGSNQGQGLGSLFGAGHIGANVDVFAGGTYRRQTDYHDGNGRVVPNSGSEVATGIGKVTVRPADGHEVKFGAITYDTNYKTGQQFPNQESVFDTNVVNNILTGRWKYQKPDDNLFDFDGNVYWTTTDQKQTKTANGTAGSLGNPITGIVGAPRSFSIDTKGFDVHNTSRFVTGDFRHAVTYGGDFFRDTVDNEDRTGAADTTTPDGVRSVGGGFVQWKGNYSTWFEAIAAARYDNYHLDGGGVTTSGERISPKGTIGITPINGFTFYGTYAEGYRAPSTTETLVAGAHPSFAVGLPPLFTYLPNPNLRPEIGKTKEVGINLKYDDIFTAGDKFRGKINVFRNDVEDYIDLVTFGPPVCFVPLPVCPPALQLNSYSLAQYQNVNDARIQGIEFESTYDAGLWFVGLSGQHIRGKEVATGMPLSSVQPDQIATTFGVRLIDRKLTLAVRWAAVAEKEASQVPDRDRNGIPDFLPTDAYNLVNLYVGYQPTPDVLAGFSIDNLLNQYYVPYLAGSPNIPGQPPGTVFPGPGITYKASLKVRFGVL